MVKNMEHVQGMVSAIPTGPTPNRNTRNGPDGHEGRPRRTKNMVTCPVVLVAYTRLCPTACGCELGQLGQGLLSRLSMMH